MKRKIIGMGVCMLMIVTAIIPVAGTPQEPINTSVTTLDGPSLEWTFIDGGPYQDMINIIRETEDKGFIAAGILENPQDVFSGWVVKLDSNGNEEWSTIETEIQGVDIYTFGICDVAQTQDGGYIVVGACERVADLQNGFLWKLTKDGETEWFNSAYTSSNMFDTYTVLPWDILPVINGYIVAGGALYMGELYGLDVDAIVMKTDLNGDVVWRQTYRYDQDHDEIHAIYPTLDGGYIALGTVNMKLYGVPSQNDSDIWVIKTDAEGNKQWEKTYGGSEDEWVLSRDMYQTSDGGYIVDAMTASYNVVNPSQDWCVMLQKLDGAGNELWNKTYGDPAQADTSWGMAFSSDGGFILPITKNHNGVTKPRDDMWLIKTDQNGNIEWDQLYGGDKTERCYSARQVSDGGYVICGATESYTVEGGWDGCVVKYAAFENTRPGTPETPSGSSRGKAFTNYTFASSAVDSDADQVFYKWDWGDGNYSEWLGPYPSGERCEAVYAWETEATYEVCVMVKDQHGGESDWSDPMPIAIPYSYSTLSHQFFEWLFQRFPNAFPLLRQLMG